MPTPRRKPVRPCLGSPLNPQCTALIQGNRCADCTRSIEQARGSTTDRGYGAAHQAEAKQALANATHCRTCSQPFTTDNPATAGHLVDIRAGGRRKGVAPQCRRCNYGWRRNQSPRT